MKTSRRVFQIAGISAGVVLVLYAIVFTAIDVTAFRSMLGDADQRISSRMFLYIRSPSTLRIPSRPTGGEGPIYWWLYGLDGKVQLAMPGAPSVPDGLRPSKPDSLDIGGHHYRINGVEAVDGQLNPTGWLVVGQSVVDVYRAIFNLALLEIVIGIPLGLLTFLGAIWIGRRSVADSARPFWCRPWAPAPSRILR